MLGFLFLEPTIPWESSLQCGVDSGNVGSVWDVYERKTLAPGLSEPILKHGWTKRGSVD